MPPVYRARARGLPWGLFLRRRRYRADTERWIEGSERRRVDLLIARLWGANSPVSLFLARTASDTAGRDGEHAERWNAQLDGSQAPIIILADP